ncbi:uncharacterized protein LOC132203746 [Neocloeon triangulifer]|uniref:uncharacterized protein LOC132203746 n=1 Tax=Neocloeon triangulifer TaxID=2078957 RepID=UPI00286F94DA|nr:uncharacterized protein LOC132203746 [Neocloeon triangulifer]XP_059487725.1 uncharacterized protein LOC132203746 [Neocloeon triangulifer]
MDSSGPWASYTYNGLPPSQAPPPGTLASSSAGQRTVADLQAMGNSQLLLAGMSPAAVAVAANSSFQLGNYDSAMFSSLFHHQKQQHHRSHQAVGQPVQMEQSSPWTPQTNSLGNPFGVLPHQASQKTNVSPNKGENTFSAHIIPPFAHSASNYGNAGAPNLPFVPQKTAPKVPIFTPKAPPKHKAAPPPPSEPRYNPSAAAAMAAASAVINNTKASNIIVHRSFPPHLQPHCRSYPSPDSDYQQRNTPDSVSSSGPYGDSDCHMSMERPSPNPSSPYYNMASPDSCVYSKPTLERQPQPQQQAQVPPPHHQFPMKPHNNWEEKRTVPAHSRSYNNYAEAENNNAFNVSDQQQQHYHSTINLADLHGGSDELLTHGGSDSEDYERSSSKRQRRNKRARKSDSPEKINRQLTLLQPVHAEDGYAASALGFHSRVAFPPLPQHQTQVHQQNAQHHQQPPQQVVPQNNNYHQPEQPQSKSVGSLIDEELGFLEMSNANKKGNTSSGPTVQLKKETPGFMDSFIKFLNGDQENSMGSSSGVRGSGRKSPPKQRGRTIPQKPPCPEVAVPPQPHQHIPQQVQMQQQPPELQHPGYQIHQVPQLENAGLREESGELSGRGRKRSLPPENLNEGGPSDEFESQSSSNEAMFNLAAQSSDKHIDSTDKMYQPRVVLSRISDYQLKRLSQTEDESNSEDCMPVADAADEVFSLPEKYKLMPDESGMQIPNYENNIENCFQMQGVNITVSGTSPTSLLEDFEKCLSGELPFEVDIKDGLESDSSRCQSLMLAAQGGSSERENKKLEHMLPPISCINKKTDTIQDLKVAANCKSGSDTDFRRVKLSQNPYYGTSNTDIENCKSGENFCVPSTTFDPESEMMEIMQENNINCKVKQEMPENSLSNSKAIKADNNEALDRPVKLPVNIKTIDEEMETLLGKNIISKMKFLIKTKAEMKPEDAFKKAFPSINIKQNRKIESTSVKRKLPGMHSAKSKPGPKRSKMEAIAPKQVKEEVTELEESDLQPKLPPNMRRRKYKTGTFMTHVKDTEKGYPRLYRVDGPEMKQVYEPFMENGELLYRSKPSYSSWNLDSYREFKVEQIEFYKKSANMNIVRVILPHSPKKTKRGIKTKSVFATAEVEDIFRTYIQALLSQAVEGGFLQVIFEEKETLFTIPIEKIDKLNEQRKNKLQSIYNFPQQILDMLDRWPQFRPQNLTVYNKCQCCQKENAIHLLEACGNVYCKQSLNPVDPDLIAADESEFIACHKCSLRVYKYCKIAHLKINCYQLCHKEMEQYDVASRIGKILETVHSSWFENLFGNLKDLWALVDSIDPNCATE